MDPTVYKRCFLFGHYDSRGGAVLIAAPNLILATEKYMIKMFGFEYDLNGHIQDSSVREMIEEELSRDGVFDLDELNREYREFKNDSINNSIENDFMFPCNVLVFDDKPFQEDQELDRRYDNNGYRYGLVQSKGKTESKWTHMSPFDTKRTLVFWKGKTPPEVSSYFKDNQREWRIIKKSYGEDAFGLLWSEVK